jgi:hypothetical protein
MLNNALCGRTGEVAEQSAPDGRNTGYEPPLLIDLGAIREVVLGNSSSGNGDANSQYYW